MSLPKEPIGIIYLPFQTQSIPHEYISLVEEAIQNHQKVIIALPVRRITPSKRSPLDFFTRLRMIQEQFGSMVTVVAVGNEKYEDRMVSVFEAAVKAPFSEMRGKVVLYTDKAFGEIYLAKGGKWRLELVPDALEIEEKLRKTASPNEFDERDEQWMYRVGVIAALRAQFPISWSTVDIAIRRIVMVDREAPPHEKIMYLLGRKPGEHGWRFPGGFKDMEDESYEVAVWREAGEEVLKEGVEKEKALTYPTYIGSRRINDWRYRGEIDGITTLFYQVTFIGNEEDIQAGDDLGDAKWFDFDEITEEMLEGEHVHLFRMLKKFEKQTKQTRLSYVDVSNMPSDTAEQVIRDTLSKKA